VVRGTAEPRDAPAEVAVSKMPELWGNVTVTPLGIADTVRRISVCWLLFGSGYVLVNPNAVRKFSATVMVVVPVTTPSAALMLTSR